MSIQEYPTGHDGSRNRIRSSRLSPLIVATGAAIAVSSAAPSAVVSMRQDLGRAALQQVGSQRREAPVQPAPAVAISEDEQRRLGHGRTRGGTNGSNGHSHISGWTEFSSAGVAVRRVEPVSGRRQSEEGQELGCEEIECPYEEGTGNIVHRVREEVFERLRGEALFITNVGDRRLATVIGEVRPDFGPQELIIYRNRRRIRVFELRDKLIEESKGEGSGKKPEIFQPEPNLESLCVLAAAKLKSSKHYRTDKSGRATLLPHGIRRLESLLGAERIYSDKQDKIVEAVERTLSAWENLPKGTHREITARAIYLPFITRLQPERDYVVDIEKREVTLTSAGIENVQTILFSIFGVELRDDGTGEASVKSIQAALAGHFWGDQIGLREIDNIELAAIRAKNDAGNEKRPLSAKEKKANRKEQEQVDLAGRRERAEERLRHLVRQAVERVLGRDRALEIKQRRSTERIFGEGLMPKRRSFVEPSELVAAERAAEEEGQAAKATPTTKSAQLEESPLLSRLAEVRMNAMAKAEAARIAKLRPRCPWVFDENTPSEMEAMWLMEYADHEDDGGDYDFDPEVGDGDWKTYAVDGVRRGTGVTVAATWDFDDTNAIAEGWPRETSRSRRRDSARYGRRGR